MKYRTFATKTVHGYEWIVEYNGVPLYGFYKHCGTKADVRDQVARLFEILENGKYRIADYCNQNVITDIEQTLLIALFLPEVTGEDKPNIIYT